MTRIGLDDLDQLVALEAHIHYAELPPPERAPFVVVRRASPTGARTPPLLPSAGPTRQTPNG